jgi:hypothetical protein
MTGTSQLTVSVSVKENGIMHHPKKRNWIKMEEEDVSFPHEIEEWKKNLCCRTPLRVIFTKREPLV